jgi:hypothetical protein
VAEVERGDGVDLPLRQRLKALPFVSTSAVLLLVTAKRRCAAGRESPASSRIERTLASLSTTHGRGFAWSKQSGLRQAAYQGDGRIPVG